MSAFPATDWRIRAIAASVGVAACGYLLLFLYSGWAGVVHGVSVVGPAGLLVLLAMSSLNYALRFGRWNLYLQAFGHRLPVREHARIYLTGFALTTTPGKAGEGIRAVFLARLGVPYTTSFAAMFSERVSDLMAVLVLCMPGLEGNPRFHGAVLLLGAAVIAGWVVLGWKGLTPRAHRLAQALRGRLGVIARHATRVIEQAQRCHAPRLLAASTLLGVAAWAAEAVAFAWLTSWLGMHLTTGYAVFVYAASLIAGAISVMPGGLGGAEAAMVALLMLKGVAAPEAAVATVLIRLATLWFAVVLGLLALFGARSGARPAHEAEEGA